MPVRPNRSAFGPTTCTTPFVALLLAAVSTLAPHAAHSADPAVETLRAQAAAALSPLDGTLRVAGLREPVEVIRDRWGVPHIEARNPHDLFFAQGFVAAQDRLFQLDLWRRSGCGENAELYGPDLVEADRFARLVRYRGDADAEWNSYGPDAREIVEAFVEGINAWIDLTADRPPVEFSWLGIRPKKWRPEDVLSRMSGIVMCGNWQREIARSQLIAAVGLDAARRAAPTDPPRDFAPHPGVDPASIVPRIARGYQLASQQPALRPPSGESNNWVVDGTLSASGRPLLAGDPHRAIGLPSLRYLVHLKAPGWNVVGAGEPALPGVAIGHNERIAWAFTIVGTDQTDLVVEQTHPDDPRKYRAGEDWLPMTIVQETIAVRGRAEPTTVELRYTRHGPVIYQDEQQHLAIALRWTGLEPGGAAYLGSLAVGRATNVNEFREALRRWKIPALNFAYADVDGHIGWIAAGATPIRQGWDGLLPTPGADGRFEWQGTLRVEDYPQRFDPPEHWLATANHNIVPPGYPHEIGYEFAPPLRYRRIRERLTAPPPGGKFSIADFQQLQHDATSLAARSLVAVLRQVEPPAALDGPARLLRDWDARLDPSSPAAALYGVWIQELENDFYAGRLPPIPDLERSSLRDLQRVVDGVTEPTEAWFGPEPVRARDRLLVEALGKAVARLRSRSGDDPGRWRWGDLHTATFRHPLAGWSPAHAALLNVGPFPRSGDVTTPNNTRSNDQFEQVHGASYRQVFDLADWDRAVATSAPGQSGQPTSPHYADLAPLWAAGDYFPLVFSRAKIEQARARRLVLEP